MPVVGRGDVNGVDIGPCQQLAEIVVRRAVGVAVVAINSGFAFVAHALAHIRDRDVLHIGAFQEIALIVRALAPDANSAHHDAIAGGRDIGIAERGRRNDIRRRNGGAGRL